jgi:hypothetical protein
MMMRTLLLGLGVMTCLVVHADTADACLATCNALDLRDGDARGKSIDGLECQIDWEDKNADWGYTNIGQICNGGYEPILVHCPLMRTQTKSTKGLSCAAAQFTIQQSPINEGACGHFAANEWNCVLRSQDATGWYGSYEGSGPWDNKPPVNEISTTDFDDGFPAANVWTAYWRAAINDSKQVTAEQGATYMLSCILPPPGSCQGETCLASLRWWER